MDALTLVTGILGLLLVLYWYFTRTFNHWNKLNVPMVKPPVIFFGNIKERFLSRLSFHEFYHNMYFEAWGRPYAGIFEGVTPSLMVRNVDLIRDILVKDFDHFEDRQVNRFKELAYISKMLVSMSGSEWKQVRHALTPTFSSGKIKGMFESVKDCADQMVTFLEKTDTQSVEMKDMFGKFTLNVIAKTAFAIDCNAYENQKSDFVVKMDEFNKIPRYLRYLMVFIIFISPPRWITRFLPVAFMNKNTVQYLAEVVKETTKYRLQHNIKANDFLQLLMEASSEGTDGKSVITEPVAIAQSVLFLIAGYETSGTTLTMVAYLLALNPQVQDKLRDEIEKQIEENGGELTYEVVNNMPYLDMVISETLRLYPPVARLDRICTKPYSLAGQLPLKVEDRLFIPVTGLHMDPTHYPEPELFRPERFSHEEKSKRSPYCYLPFGAGPRVCIGLRFALMSSKIGLINLVKNYKIVKNEKTTTPFDYDPKAFLLKSKGGVHVTLTPINP